MGTERDLQQAVARARVANDIDGLRAAFDESLATDDKAGAESIALALARMAPSPEVRRMASELARSEHLQVRRLALRTLWLMASHASLDVFADALEDDDYQCRLWAIYGLARIGGSTADGLLLVATTASDARTRAQAVRHLGFSDEARERLEELLIDRSWHVRRAAHKRLKALI